MADNRVRKTQGRNKEAVALMKLEGIKYTEALRRVRNTNTPTEPEASDRQG